MGNSDHPLHRQDDQQRAEDAATAFWDTIDAPVEEYEKRVKPTRADLRAAWLDGSLSLAQYAAAYNQLFPDDEPPIPDWKPKWTDE